MLTWNSSSVNSVRNPTVKVLSVSATSRTASVVPTSSRGLVSTSLSLHISWRLVKDTAGDKSGEEGAG